MGEATKIEWCQNSDGSPGYTFNPWRGCAKVSEACRFCYAERDRYVRLHGVEWGPTAERRIAADSTWAQPLAWAAKHRRAKTRGRVFCASLADVFEDRPELEAPRIRLLALIALTPSLDWLLLTKRPEVMARVMTDPGLYERVLAAANVWRRAFPRHNLSAIPVTNPCDGWHNLWAGTTVENQRSADQRIPHLLRVPAAVRFLSCEPLLGPVQLGPMDGCETCGPSGYIRRQSDGLILVCPRCGGGDGRIAWVIAGGESGPGARPTHPDWFRGLRDQCARAGVPFFFKQHGDWLDEGHAHILSDEAQAEILAGRGPRDTGVYSAGSSGVRSRMFHVGKHVAGRLLDGRTWDELPGGTP